MSPLVYRRLSDEQLGGRLAHGEASAFDELYRRYSHRLAAYGAHLLGDGASGDDVAQSTLLKAYGALREGRVPAQVRPWLYRIAHNVAVDVVRRRREVPAATLPEGVAPAAGEAGALVAALATLPDRQRHVYALRELQGLRIDETAAELGLTAAQVEQALFAARNRLAEHLVFGDRLNCAAVQRLAAGPLDLSERRALKTHLRSCPTCRGELGVRGRALGALPLAPSEWLQWLGGLFAGGGAPVAAKVGVIAAAATVAAGVPLAADRPAHIFHAEPAARAAVSQQPTTTRRPAAAPRHVVAQTIAAPAPAPAVHHVAPLVMHLAPTHGTPTPDNAPQPRERPERHDGGDGGGGGGSGEHEHTAPSIPVTSIQPSAQPTTTGETTTTTAPVTTTTTTTPTTTEPVAAAPTDTVTSSDGSGSNDTSGGDGGSSDGGDTSQSDSGSTSN